MEFIIKLSAYSAELVSQECGRNIRLTCLLDLLQEKPQLPYGTILADIKLNKYAVERLLDILGNVFFIFKQA